jgi:pyridoxamine 5'-phosphate oxidase
VPASSPSRRLVESSVSQDPIEQFGTWMHEATRELPLPEAVALATVGQGPLMRPSVRMVLARSWDERGFVFYTDYRSRKAEEIDSHPFGALVFHWSPLGRQVRVEGPVERVSAEESDRYFAGRPRGSQIAARTSVQSRPVADREELDRRYAACEAELSGAEVTRPEHWGGYRLAPEVMEFWQQRENRLHDRLRYSRDAAGWRVQRLEP